MALEQIYTQTIELIESASDCTATITPSIEGKDKVSVCLETKDGVFVAQTVTAIGNLWMTYTDHELGTSEAVIQVEMDGQPQKTVFFVRSVTWKWVDRETHIKLDVRTLGWTDEIEANLNTKRTETTIFVEGEE